MHHGSRRAVIAAVALSLSMPLLAAAPAQSATWAPASTAKIHPGVQTVTAGGQCTANFIFTNGTDVFIGQAAHCASTGGQTDTNGCNTGSQPLGTPVDVQGATHPGTLAYSSWLAMQAIGETDPDTCAYNDLALVRLDPADVAQVNPSIPFWGGPTGVGTSGAPTGSTVYSYGSSELRLGITALSPKTGTSLGDSGGGWSHDVYTVSPGIPGDSGSAFLDSTGQALGILSTLELAPMAGANGVGDVSREITYAQAHGAGFAGLALVPGDVAFNGSQLPINLANPLGG